MGIIRKLFGSEKEEVSPDEMAHMVLQAAVDLAVRDEDSLREILQSHGLETDDEVEYQAELIAYQLFLLDVVINRVFAPDADPIRRRVRERFADLALRVAKQAGIDPEPREEYIGFLESRFRDYTPALRRSMESEGQPEHGAFALPDAVFQNIVGADDTSLGAKMALAAQWPTVLSQYGEALQEYDVVTEP